MDYWQGLNNFLHLSITPLYSATLLYPPCVFSINLLLTLNKDMVVILKYLADIMAITLPGLQRLSLNYFIVTAFYRLKI